MEIFHLDAEKNTFIIEGYHKGEFYSYQGRFSYTETTYMDGDGIYTPFEQCSDIEVFDIEIEDEDFNFIEFNPKDLSCLIERELYGL